MWVVNALPPSSGWVYTDGYFPRKYKYKKEAKRVAERLFKEGGLSITVRKVK